MCENMAICVKIWLSLDICVTYAQYVKIWPFRWKFDFHWIFVWHVLNVWKYGHLCKKLTFIRSFCVICSTCENMVICVKIWLLFDICVKYAQCVKIWLFLKCVHLLSCVQFIMKKKGDVHWLRASHIGRKGGHTLATCVSHLSNSTKKKGNGIFSTGCSLHMPATVPIATHMNTYVLQCPTSGSTTRSTAWSTTCLRSSKPSDCHMFKIWWPCILAGEVGLNL
jgi:hypothetical protein